MTLKRKTRFLDVVAKILTDDDETPPCQECGACCAYYSNIAVSENDPNLEFLRSRDLVRETGFGDYQMRVDSINRCRALTGEVGEKVECSIYDHRPAACREYTAGAGMCQLARVFTFAELSKNGKE